MANWKYLPSIFADNTEGGFIIEQYVLRAIAIDTVPIKSHYKNQNITSQVNNLLYLILKMINVKLKHVYMA